MPHTRTDLIVEVLDLLGVTEAGQDPSAEDAQKVDRKINTVLAGLTQRGVLYVQNSDAIDDEYFDPIAAILANIVGPKFGQPMDLALERAQEAKLREMQREPGLGDVVKACYF